MACSWMNFPFVEDASGIVFYELILLFTSDVYIFVLIVTSMKNVHN